MKSALSVGVSVIVLSKDVEPAPRLFANEERKDEWMFEGKRRALHKMQDKVVVPAHANDKTSKELFLRREDNIESKTVP